MNGVVRVKLENAIIQATNVFYLALVFYHTAFGAIREISRN
jgi:hypothetical protein